jgi:hypothetical protein
MCIHTCICMYMHGQGLEIGQHLAYLTGDNEWQSWRPYHIHTQCVRMNRPTYGLIELEKLCFNLVLPKIWHCLQVPGRVTAVCGQATRCLKCGVYPARRKWRFLDGETPSLSAVLIRWCLPPWGRSNIAPKPDQSFGKGFSSLCCLGSRQLPYLYRPSNGAGGDSHVKKLLLQSAVPIGNLILKITFACYLIWYRWGSSADSQRGVEFSPREKHYGKRDKKLTLSIHANWCTCVDTILVFEFLFQNGGLIYMYIRSIVRSTLQQ